MIVSHKYKFIFIKTKKTAGTSIEADLNRFLGDEDIATELKPAVEGHRSRNTVVNGKKLGSHTPARRIRKAVGSEVFNSYTKFCVEREPIDKCISFFSMIKNSPAHNTTNRQWTWEQYLKRREFPTDHYRYTDVFGRLIVDRILKYENLNEELVGVMNSLGVPFTGLEARAKSGFREAGLSFDTIKVEDRAFIYRRFSKSLRHTGYQLA